MWYVLKLLLKVIKNNTALLEITGLSYFIMCLRNFFLWSQYIEIIFGYFFELGFSNYKIRKTHFPIYSFFSFASNRRKEGLFSVFLQARSIKMMWTSFCCHR